MRHQRSPMGSCMLTTALQKRNKAKMEMKYLKFQVFFKKRLNKKFKSFSKALSNIQGPFKTVRMAKRTGRQ